jgi:cytochrome b561
MALSEKQGSAVNELSISKYTRTAVAFHWLIAVLIVTNYVLFLVSDGLPDAQREAYMTPHMSIGISILALSILRLSWRLTHKPPPLPIDIKGWEVTLSKVVHFIFYFMIIAIPFTGWLMVSAYPVAPPVNFFGFFEIDLPFGKSKALSGFGHEAHEILTYALYGLVALHIAGALKHQFAERMPFIQRMWP